MKNLASVVGSVQVARTDESSSQRRTVEILAKAHGISEEGMTALWRGSRLTPPTDDARVAKYRASKSLVQELRRRANEQREKVLERAISKAWLTTQLEGLAAKRPRPTFDQLLAKIKDPTLRAFAEKFNPDGSGGALVLGPTGVGKSIAVLCLMIRCMAEEALCDFDTSLKVPFGDWVQLVIPKTWTSVDAIDLCTAQQRAGLSDPDPPIVCMAKTSDYLILEDLGWERGFHVETLIQVAVPRYRRCLPTFVTSGEKHKALRERYTDAVLRRFWNINGQDGAVVDLWQAQKSRPTVVQR